MTWSYGYFTDLNYSYGYYPEMNPALLRLACLCQAVEPQLRENPTYLELGFGQGVAINMHAAASAGAFWGTDFNPAQAIEARKFARASGADVHLYDQSFEELARRDDLPDFDVIALHGIWSWISEANRKVIIDIIRRKLRPGGIAYISYNCLPGWAPVIPLRQLLTLYQNYGGGAMAGPLSAIEGALQFSGEIAKAGSVYFKENPFAGHHLEKMMKNGRNYIAHEYMNADWYLTDFSDMVGSLGEAKLTFVGSARLLDGIDTFHLTDDGRKITSQIGHPIMRETVRDYLVNRRFRCDVFVKGARKMPGPDHREAWHRQCFVLTVPPSDISLKIPCALGELGLPAERYQPVIEALCDHQGRPQRVDDLLRHPKLRGFKGEELVEVLMVLTGSGYASPAQEPSEKVRNQCKALNDYILQRARLSTDLNFMTSPITGGGIAVPHIAQLFILAIREGKTSADALTKYVWEFLDNVGERLYKDGKRVESKEENLREFRTMADRFLQLGKPLLEALEIIERPNSPALSAGTQIRSR